VAKGYETLRVFFASLIDGTLTMRSRPAGESPDWGETVKENILLIEDEPSVRSTLLVRLRSEGYVVETANDGTEGLEKATSSPFDLIILDIMLPDRNGFDICRDIRQAGLAIPILILTARKQTTDMVVGLKLGADDYVTKPFKSEELLARIEVLLRRVPIRAGFGVHQFGPIRIDLRRAEVTRDGIRVYLSAREFQLLRYFVERAGTTIPRSELLQSIWGYNEKTLTRTVDMHVSSLREKLEQVPKSPELIVTVSGIGYRFMGSTNF
jgi:two-component system alkaline phosphatase synthesis response regulator PhoP